MFRFAACLLLLSTTAFSQAPAKVESLGWMSGTWVNESSRGKVAESWLGPGNGVMVAANLSTFAGGRKSFEFLRIAETPEGFSYFASPGGRAPVEFKLKEAGAQRVVFENAAHDFPQRILYWREGEALVARIEGTIKGEARQQEWKFSRH
ncbi:MAG: DUF6265 family protein [Usitatibacter sp.]